MAEAALFAHYLRNKDLTARPRNSFVIDFFGFTEKQAAEAWPQAYQYLLQHVKHERQQSRRKAYREKWWLFVEPRPALRAAVNNLERYIATPEVAKFRPFLFVDQRVVPDASLYIIATDDAFTLGVLSSRIHLTWTLGPGVGGTLENRPRYHNTHCFEPFPFPAPPEAQRASIRDLGEQLDAHRKKVLAEHPDLTLTGLYNVLEKLKAGEALSAREKSIHERGLVSVMKHLHDQIDTAVFEAYGWPQDLSDEEILARLVELNKERRAEEASGHVRWLRPEYQAPRAKLPKEEQAELDIAAVPTDVIDGKIAWPGKLPERVTSVRTMLGRQPKPVGLEELSRQFQRARRDDVQDVLNTLVALGLARRVEGDRYAP